MNIFSLLFLLFMVFIEVNLFSIGGEEPPLKKRKVESDQTTGFSESSSSSSSSNSSSCDNQLSSLWQIRRERFEKEEKDRKKKREKEDLLNKCKKEEEEKKVIESIRKDQELLNILEDLFSSLLFQLEEFSTAQSFAMVNDILELFIEALSISDISFAELKSYENENIRNFATKFGSIPLQIIEKIESNQFLKEAIYVRLSVEKIDESMKAICTILGEPEVLLSFDMNTDCDDFEALKVQQVFEDERGVEDEDFARIVQDVENDEHLAEQSRILAEQLNREIND